MNFEILKKLREFIDAHKAFEKSHCKAMNQDLEVFKDPALSSRYTADGLTQTIMEITSGYKSDWAKADALYNQKVQVLIGDAVKEIQKLIEPKFKKPADYATQIANAMKFIELEGKDINDSTAVMVLEDFVGDHTQMNRFRHMIQKQKGVESLLDWNGKTTFPMTFGKLQKYEDIKNELNNFAVNGAALFLTKKENTIESFAGERYAIPVDSPFDTYHETAVLDSAKRLETLLSEVEESNEPTTLEDVMNDYHEGGSDEPDADEE